MNAQMLEDGKKAGVVSQDVEQERRPTQEELASKVGLKSPLTMADLETLDELEPGDRILAMKNWQDKEKTMRFSSNIERYKVKMAFLEGIVLGKLGLEPVSVEPEKESSASETSGS